MPRGPKGEKRPKTLRVTPTMAAGVSKTLMTWEDFIALMDAEAPKPGPRGPYKKGQADAAQI